MRVKHLFILSFVALACACTGCNGGGDEQPELQWGKSSLCVENPIAPGDSLCYQIKFDLDTLGGDSQLAKQLAAVITDSVLRVSGFATVQEAMAQRADGLEAEWKADLAEMYDAESDFRETLQYYYTIDGSPVEKAEPDGVLSYQTTEDIYLGGAHGIYVIQYYNFDEKSGKLLNIGDVIPADKETLALKAMEEQLCKDWDAENLEDLREQTGITMLGDLYLTNNFLLKKDSIEFLFNQYEIAPYAAGLIGVTIKRP